MESLLKSTLQKCVRRGNWELAGKILSYFNSKQKPSFVFLRRLPIIIVEDSILLRGAEPLFSFNLTEDVLRYMVFAAQYPYRDATVIHKFENKLITEQMYGKFQMVENGQLDLFNQVKGEDELLIKMKNFANRYIKKTKGDYKIFVVAYDNMTNGYYDEFFNDYVDWMERGGKNIKFSDFEPVKKEDLIQFPYGSDFHVFGDAFTKLVAKKLDVDPKEAKRLIWAIHSSPNDKKCVITKREFNYIKFYEYNKTYTPQQIKEIADVVKEIAIWFIEKRFKN